MVKQRKKRESIKDQALHKVYPFLVKYRKEHKTAPSLYEVAVNFKKTVEWVRYCYKELIKADLIRVTRYKQRGVLLVNR